MSTFDAHEGISDADVAALEALWRTTAGAPAESFLKQCIAQSRAELAADRQQRAAMRFYLAAAAVLLIGWHLSLLATSSIVSRADGGDVASPAQFADDRRVLLAELTDELALENSGESVTGHSAPFTPHGAKTRD